MAGRQVRTAISIPDDLHQDLKRLIPWGFRQPMMVEALRMMVRSVEKDGTGAIAGLIDGKYELRKRRR